ncbi:MAG: metallophosphoesterase [Deltaproteobacteria bacterium]|nr:metallophosphoesterase [Deltaproteobacteria bacterium]
MKTLVIGDIHGCYTELQELLDRVGLSSQDEVIAIGDIVDRGPDSPNVLEFFRTQANARSLMGNHERKHVRSFRGELQPALSQIITGHQLGADGYSSAVSYMARLPHFLDLPEAILVHGFFEPGRSLPDQRPTVIIGTMSGETYLKRQYQRPWYELYDGQKPVIVGHTDYLRTGKPLIYRDRVFGIDTSCCHGGALTGLLLPDFRIFSVPSRRDYWKETKAWYAGIRLATTPDESLSWDDMARLVSQAEKASNSSPSLDERVRRLRSMITVAEEALKNLFDYIAEENDRVLKTLQEEFPFDEMSSREKSRLYGARVGKTPLARFLHRARKGELSLEGLQKAFKKPGDLISFARRIGLLNPSETHDKAS